MNSFELMLRLTVAIIPIVVAGFAWALWIDRNRNRRVPVSPVAFLLTATMVGLIVWARSFAPISPVGVWNTTDGLFATVLVGQYTLVLFGVVATTGMLVFRLDRWFRGRFAADESPLSS